jgi:transmembrane sensor
MVSNRKKFDGDIGLSDEAIEWIVKLSSGRSTTADHKEFARWRQQSQAHELAALEAETLWYGIGSSAKISQRTARRASITRRGFIVVAAASLTGLSFERTGIIGPGLFADHVTGAAERRTIRLADGSTALLNGNTALSVSMTAQERRLWLYKGQAHFAVSKDTTRPFIVEARNGRSVATGTAFDVDIRADRVVVTVTEGAVAVSNTLRTDDARAETVGVTVNQRVSYARSGSLSNPETVDAELETAWRRGKLIFDEQPLGDVLSALERCHSGKIIVANSALYSLRVTGVFDLRHPETLLQMMEATLPVSVHTLPFVTILR